MGIFAGTGFSGLDHDEARFGESIAMVHDEYRRGDHGSR